MTAPKGAERLWERRKKGQKRCFFSLKTEFINEVAKNAKNSCERHKMAIFQPVLCDF